MTYPNIDFCVNRTVTELYIKKKNTFKLHGHSMVVIDRHV